MRILIVDGSKESRRDMVEALGQLTNVVIQGAVANVRTALHAVAETPPDIVVTDVQLPDGDSAHLVERIRRLERSPHIVVITTTASEVQRQRYLAAGADRYVTRDDDLRSLTETVAGLTTKRHRLGSIPPGDTERLLGRMTAGVVHDFNNYLGVLEAMVTLLRRQPQDEELWGQMRAALDAITRLNGTLLDYARGAPPKASELDFGELARNVLGISGRLIPTNVSLTLEIGEGLRPVHGIGSQLEQLVLNLVVNAIDAMPDGGELGITVTATGTAAVMLRVTDTGAGMPRDSTASTKPGRYGGGLGLGIVQSVVERHEGALRFSEATGGGTVVTLILPAL